MDIALTLKELLETSGVSRSKLARDIGVHTSTVSNWLDGKAVKSENLASLCAYFNCSLDYLTGTTAKNEKTPTLPKKDEREISDDDIKFALFGDKTIDDETYESVKNFAKFAAEQKRKRQESEQ